MTHSLDELETHTLGPGFRESIDASTMQGDNKSLKITEQAGGGSTMIQTLTHSQKFSFEQDLQASRVYGRIAHRPSRLSLASSAGRSRGCSYLSEFALSEVSHISILSLRIPPSKIYNTNDYPSNSDQAIDTARRKSAAAKISLTRTSVGRGRRQEQQELVFGRDENFSGGITVTRTVHVENVDVTAAANLWPPETVKKWLRESSLHQSILQDLNTEDLSGFSILRLVPTDLPRLGIKHASEQRCLWTSIRRLQTLIFNELCLKQGEICLPENFIYTSPDEERCCSPRTIYEGQYHRAYFRSRERSPCIHGEEAMFDIWGRPICCDAASDDYENANEDSAEDELAQDGVSENALDEHGQAQRKLGQSFYLEEESDRLTGDDDDNESDDEKNDYLKFSKSKISNLGQMRPSSMLRC